MSLYRWFSTNWLLLGMVLVCIGLATNYSIERIYLDSQSRTLETIIREVDSESEKLSNMWLYNDIKRKDLSELTDINKRYKDVIVLFYDGGVCKYCSKYPILNDSIILSIKTGYGIEVIKDRIIYKNIKEHKNRKIIIYFPITHIENVPNLYSKLNSSLDLIDNSVFTVNIDKNIGIPVSNELSESLVYLGFKTNSIDVYIGVIIVWMGLFVLIYGCMMSIVQRSVVRKRFLLRLSLCVLFIVGVRFLTEWVSPLYRMGRMFDAQNPVNERLSMFLGADTTIADMLINVILFALFIGIVISLQKSFFLSVTNYMKTNKSWIVVVSWSIVSSLALLWLVYAVVVLLSSVLITNNIVDYISNFNAFMLTALLIILILFASLYSLSCLERRVLLDKSIVAVEVIRLVITSVVIIIFNKEYLNNAILIISGIFTISFTKCLYIQFNKSYSNFVYLLIISMSVAAVILFDCSGIKDKTQIRVAENLLLEKQYGSDYYSFMAQDARYQFPQKYFFSYAKLKDGKIINSGGTYVYSNILSTKLKPGFINNSGFKHYVISDQTGCNTVIVSRILIGFADYITLTFYFLFIFGIGGFILFEVYSVVVDMFLWKNNLYFMAKIVMITVFVISIIIVIITIASYFKNSQEKKELSDLVLKSQSIITSLKNVCENHGYYSDMCKEYIFKIEKGYAVNINIFDSSGRFIMTSSEFAEQKLFVPRYIDTEIIRTLSSEETLFCTFERVMDDVNYRSYVAKIDGDSNGYIQIIDYSCFVKSGVDVLLLSISNIFIVVMLILFFVLVFFYRQGMKPIMLLRDSLSNIKYQKKIDTTMYRRGSDIDTLVDMYNNAIEELEITLVKLAESGRNEALKVMAQQVAHEIKNPLTPIKLKAQMILYRKRNGDRNWDKNIEDSMESIVTQIDILNEIISEFSSMATMGCSVKERCDLDKTLTTIVDFYSGYSNINIIYNNNEDNQLIEVLMSKDNLWSIITNVMVNAVQAIGDKRDGRININLYLDSDDNAIISIEDNGVGIEDIQKPNIFRPNFTTKKSGSGIGLTITMGFVKGASGNIWFNSEYGRGTTFFIKFPRIID